VAYRQTEHAGAQVQQAIDFLLRIWGVQAQSHEGSYFCISTKSKNGKWHDHFFQWPIEPRKLRQFFMLKDTDDYNLYFCAHGFKSPKRKKEEATPTAFLWADLDEAHPSKCSPVPQVAWQSSPKRYAALWRLNTHYAPGDIEQVNKVLSYASGADKGGWDLTQVLRIPGTRNHKYQGSPYGKMIWEKDNKYRLKDFPKEISVESDANSVLAKYARKLKKDTIRLLTASRATVGKRSEVIWRLENELHEQGVSPGDTYVLIKNSVWNKFAGRHDEEAQLRRELEKTRGQGTYGDAKPKQSAKLKRPKINFIRMSDVEAEDVDWLWYPYIPRGKLTIIEGDPGLGKSWITMALSSYVSLGKRFPGVEPDDAVDGNILLMSAEDGLGDTIRPRLDTMAAQVDRINAIEDPVTFDEDGIGDMREVLDEIKPILVIVDPLVAYMGGGVDMHKANETREVMAGMARLAAEYKAAFVIIRHLTKGSRDKSIYRGIGSIDITAAARSVIMVGRNPESPDEGRVLCHIKSNLAPLGKPQAYVLRPKSPRPFKFEGPCNFTPEEVFKAEPTGSGDDALRDAVEWLKQRLIDGTSPRDEVTRDAEAKGISTKTLNAARKEAGILVVVKKGITSWRLPD
jgi:hypothetical protein